jgi:DNA modification methylase
MNSVTRNVETKPIADLLASKGNARTHSKRQVEQIAGSIKKFGFTNPVLVDEDNRVMAGHGRIEAAKFLGLNEVPCLSIAGMSAADKRAYVLADNKLALNAGWDMEILATELSELVDLDFDVSLTGFELPEIDALLVASAECATSPARPEDDHPQPETRQATTGIGDTWLLGRHLLRCGDAKKSEDVEALVGGAKVDMVFTDPPYNVPIAGHVSGLGRTRHREFAEASGEMSSAEFTQFLVDSFENLERACRDGAIVYTCMDWRHMAEALAAGSGVFDQLKNICVWSKTNGGMGTFYRSQHEMVLVWKVGDAPHTNNFGLGDKGRYRTNVWTYPGVNTFKAERMNELMLHPTVKPVALVADAIRDVTNRGQVVLDTFGGSGTTLIAAEKTGRRALLLEIDPTYCDVIVRRWQNLTGKDATLSGDGRTFESIEAERRHHAHANPGWGEAQ